jgi:hypothetical protein
MNRIDQSSSIIDRCLIMSKGLLSEDYWQVAA